MQFHTWRLIPLIGILVISACAGPAEPPAPTVTAAPLAQSTREPSPMAETPVLTATLPPTDTATITASEPVDTATAAAQALPVWQTLALTNARTGEAFRLADFAGKTVFVETMATWCTNCRQQLGQVKAATAAVDAAQVVFVALSVETDLPAETLATYSNEHGFDWIFAVATPEMVQALAAAFGQTITNPPATPHFLIQPDGSHGDLITGIDSSEQILTLLRQ